eukprot:m.41639 g.41639  ORF g.41639 m.41639 type:complete len:859 (+) comp33209_c0_seq3:2643-5219(+)
MQSTNVGALQFVSVLLLLLRLLLSVTGSLPESFLIVSEQRWIRGLAINESTGTLYDVIPPVTSVTQAIGVDFDATGSGSIFWTDYAKKAVMRAPLTENGTATTVVPALPKPDGVAVDWVGSHIYYTDSHLNLIGMASFDGYFAMPVVENKLDIPRAISLDPEDGWMYWSDWGANPRIERAYMNGLGREVLVNSSLVYPNGIALDLKERLLYWADANLDMLEVCNLNGTGRRLLGIFRAKKVHPFSMTLFKKHLYWTDWTKHGIVQIAVNRPTEARQIAKTISANDLPMGITTYDSRRVSGRNGCSHKNGGCEQLCMAMPSGRRTCQCSYGRLASDGRNCLQDESYILYSDIDSIRALTFTPNETREATFAVLPTSIPYGLDYAKSLGLVFWAEESSGTIVKAEYPIGRRPSVFLRTGGRPTAVAFDWMGGNLFYVDKSLKEIGVCRVNVAEVGQQNCKLIFRSDLGSPTSVAVDPASGYIYWTDSDIKFNRIERSFMSGDGREVIVTGGGIDSPRTVALDLVNRKLYWTEYHSNEIGVSNLDGSRRSVLIAQHPLLDDPSGLTIFNGYLYITSAGIDCVLRARQNGSDLKLFRKTRDTPDGILVVHPSMQSGSNMCSQSNGQCRHLCLSEPGGRQCACPSEKSSDCLPDVTLLTMTPAAAVATLDLHCGITSYGVPFTSVIWLHDNETVSKSSYDARSNRPAVVTLRLDPVKLGLYTCRVVNEYGEVESNQAVVAILVSPTALSGSSSMTTIIYSVSSSSMTTILYSVSCAAVVVIVFAIVLTVCLCRRRRSKSAVPTYVENPMSPRSRSYSESSDVALTVTKSPRREMALAYSLRQNSTLNNNLNLKPSSTPAKTVI